MRKNSADTDKMPKHPHSISRAFTLSNARILKIFCNVHVILQDSYDGCFGKYFMSLELSDGLA